MTYILEPILNRFVDKVDYGPWNTVVGVSGRSLRDSGLTLVQAPPLYTPEERRRRDETPWTTVQGVLAPVQFVVFAISLWLVIAFLATGDGLLAATVSIVIKTFILYAIMITGSIWEREVFGRYLFARAFFWEDVVSIGVLVLHTAYLCALALGAEVALQMAIALAAYGSYVVNATQFFLKLRAARLQQGDADQARVPAGAGR